jgi:hypothetical protein
MADSDPATVASESKVIYASSATVKRKKMSYGKTGILALTTNTLVFYASDPSLSWEIPTASIGHLKKPWYGMGSYLTFDVNGAYYALAFGRRGPSVPASAGGLAMRAGGVAGVGAGLFADAVAVSQLRAAAGVGGQWWTQLRRATGA